MHIEERLEHIATLLQGIHTALTSAAAVAPAPAAKAAKADKPTVINNPGPNGAPTPVAAPTPAAPKAVSWKDDVMPKILELNKSTKPGGGREGVLKLLAHFGLGEGKKVPDLEPLGKHTEVLDAVKTLLDGGTLGGAEADDLGI